MEIQVRKAQRLSQWQRQTLCPLAYKLALDGSHKLLSPPMGFKGVTLRPASSGLSEYGSLHNMSEWVFVAQSYLTLWQPHGLQPAKAPLSMGFSRPEYWNGLPFPSPGDVPYPADELGSPAVAGRFFTTWATREVTVSRFPFTTSVTTWHQQQGNTTKGKLYVRLLWKA